MFGTVSYLRGILSVLLEIDLGNLYINLPKFHSVLMKAVIFDCVSLSFRGIRFDREPPTRTRLIWIVNFCLSRGLSTCRIKPRLDRSWVMLARTRYWVTLSTGNSFIDENLFWACRNDRGHVLQTMKLGLKYLTTSKRNCKQRWSSENIKLKHENVANSPSSEPRQTKCMLLGFFMFLYVYCEYEVGWYPFCWSLTSTWRPQWLPCAW